MPKFLEDKLKKEYGADSSTPYKIMNKIGAMHGNKITAAGKEMERKHEMHIHGASEHEVVYLGEPSDVREVDMAQYGHDWEPRQYKDSIVGHEPYSHEKDRMQHGMVFTPGQISQDPD